MGMVVVQVGQVRMGVHQHVLMGVAVAVAPDELHAVLVVVVHVGVGVLVLVDCRLVAVLVEMRRLDRQPHPDSSQRNCADNILNSQRYTRTRNKLTEIIKKFFTFVQPEAIANSSGRTSASEKSTRQQL